MIVLLHVVMALLSIVSASLTYIQPSRNKLRASYGLVAATFISGTYLVISTHSNLVSSCFAGLAYLGLVSSTLFAAQHKMAVSSRNTDS